MTIRTGDVPVNAMGEATELVASPFSTLFELLFTL